MPLQALQIFDKADLQEIGLPMGARPSHLRARRVVCC
eukprot:COSAG01_NODE_38443_length_489_cov_1.374359_1_plen_36_part_10